MEAYSHRIDIDRYYARSTAMNDIATAIATERAQTFLTQARTDGLARLARCCSPSGVVRGMQHVRSAGRATLHWLRAGQLAGYPATCC
jgi:hypothetical protein